MLVSTEPLIRLAVLKLRNLVANQSDMNGSAASFVQTLAPGVGTCATWSELQKRIARSCKALFHALRAMPGLTVTIN